MIIAAWAKQKVVHEIMLFLLSYRVGTSRAVRHVQNLAPTRCK
jgi:hypothetical protein